MRVSRIELDGVTTHTATDIQIPASGVVLVTGPNGSGKSSLLEATPLVLWGRTLRGSKVWPPDPPGPKLVRTAAITLDGVRYCRTQRGSTSTLSWPGAPVYESTRHALDALALRVGPFATWRQSCVLSSSDAASFTCASDTDRKRLVERLAGLTRYELAHDQLKARLRAARLAVALAERTSSHAGQRVLAAKARLASCQAPTAPSKPGQPPSPPAPLDVTAGQLERLDSMLGAARADLAGYQQEERVAAGQLAVAMARAKAHSQSRCSACDQPIPAHHRDASQAGLSEAEDQLDQAASLVSQARLAVQQVAEEQQALSRLVREHQRAEQTYQASQAAYQRELAAYQQADQLAARLASQRKAAQAELAEAKQASQQASTDEQAARSDLAHLEAAVQVTGPKGLRGALLADTLGALEAAANFYLASLSDTLRLEIRATDADGSTAGKVLLGVHGAGGGHGYKGASGGERRRMDVALMLGLAQIAGAARGGPPATLWADEVFDALDLDGQARVAGLLADLAADRAVVVIAHQAQDALSELASLSYRVDRGRVTLT